jgi:hypothetical protein
MLQTPAQHRIGNQRRLRQAVPSLSSSSDRAHATGSPARPRSHRARLRGSSRASPLRRRSWSAPPRSGPTGLPSKTSSARAQADDALHEHLCQRHVVDVDDGRQAALGAELADQAHDLAAGLGIERGGGFVDQQQARVLDQRAAMPTRWRCPPESSSARLSAMAAGRRGRAGETPRRCRLAGICAGSCARSRHSRAVPTGRSP